MKTGISTACLYPMETERALERLLTHGFRCFEIFINAVRELSPSYMGRISRLLARDGGKIYSYHLFTAAFEPLLFFSDYPARFADSVEMYRRWAAVMARAGAAVAVLHGARRDTRLSIAEYCGRFDRIARALRTEGVTLAQENVTRCLSATSDSIRRMRACAGPGGMKFVLDVKQAVRAGEDPADMLEAMGDDVVNVHISDRDRTHDCLLPGEGRMDYSALLRHLRRHRYNGPLMIEVYRGSFAKADQLERAGRLLGALTAEDGGTPEGNGFSDSV